MSGLDWTVRRDFASGITVVRLHGELRQERADELTRMLHRCWLDEPLALVVELDRVRVVDVAVLAIFTDAVPAGEPTAARTLILAVNAFTPTGRLVHAATGGAARICASVAEAVVAATGPGAGGDDRRHAHLAPHPLAPTAARQLVEAACRAWRLPLVLDNALVVMSELVSNAVEHAGTELDVTVTRHGDLVRLSVRDRTQDPPLVMPPVDVAGVAQRGRGLAVVGAFSLSWGYAPAVDGKSVWALVGPAGG
jgi:signal transduction histidine kinase